MPSSDENPSQPQQPNVGGALRRLLRLEPGETKPVCFSAIMFFCLLCSYYLVRPIRGAVATGEVENLEWLYLGTLIGMLVANPIFAALVTWLPRRRFIPITFRFFAANLLVFFAILYFQPQHLPTRIAFYIWVSVFNLFIVSVFWALMADVFHTNQSKRLFGYIGAVGTIGAIVGAWVADTISGAASSGRLSPRLLFFVLICSALLLECAVHAARAVMRNAGEADEPIGARDSHVEVRSSALDWTRRLLAGITLIARSPYLLGICCYLLLYTVTSTFLDFQLNHAMNAELPTDAARSQLWARLDFWINGLTLLIQIALTGRVMSRLGVGVTLATLPLVTLLGFFALAMIQSGRWQLTGGEIMGLSAALFITASFYVLRRASNFALARPARETLYTVVSRDEKYKSKSFIDTFVYRGGDQIGAFSFAFVQKTLQWSMSRVSIAIVPLAAAWIVLAIALGVAQRVRQRRAEVADQHRLRGH